MDLLGLWGRTIVGFLSTAVFLLCFPILNAFTQPVSVLYAEDYEPLVLRLSESYAKTNLLAVACVTVPFLLVLLALTMRKRGYSRVRAFSVLLIPFVVAATIDYFIAAQSDKYLRFPRYGLAIPWRNIFQVSQLLETLFVTLVYIGICSAILYLFVRWPSPKAGKA
jgi:hypothetical protein